MWCSLYLRLVIPYKVVEGSITTSPPSNLQAKSIVLLLQPPHRYCRKLVLLPCSAQQEGSHQVTNQVVFCSSPASLPAGHFRWLSRSCRQQPTFLCYRKACFRYGCPNESNLLQQDTPTITACRALNQLLGTYWWTALLLATVIQSSSPHCILTHIYIHPKATIHITWHLPVWVYAMIFTETNIVTWPHVGQSDIIFSPYIIILAGKVKYLMCVRGQILMTPIFNSWRHG